MEFDAKTGDVAQRGGFKLFRDVCPFSTSMSGEYTNASLNFGCLKPGEYYFFQWKPHFSLHVECPRYCRRLIPRLMPRRRRPPRPGALADLSPTRILTQIIALQALYYASAVILIVFTALVAGKEIGLDLLLSWRSLRGDTTVGWTLGLVWLLNSVVRY